MTNHDERSKDNQRDDDDPAEASTASDSGAAGSGGFFKGSPSEEPTRSTSGASSGAPDGAPAQPIPEQIGPYKILSVLGEGGMGVVYRAEQTQPRREVALKLIRPGVVTGSLLKRFQLEADILARLQHPGIAQVYQADLYEGAPYFAMELIEGETLTRHARAHNLSIKQRLELFAKVCDAVQHAHQKGVVHRDLKPGNILVTKDGQPKILDFGVARATDGDIQTTTIETDIGQLIGTIPYMSPEQASGDPHAIDTRSDVYALGVILYELLAGRLPYDLSKKLVHEAVRIIQEDDPTRLSSIHKTLRGDVETIVGKALEKEKDRRYQSASAVSADIRRYLSDVPIAARPPSATYQLRKFAKRNRALVTGVAAVFVVLVAGVIASTTFAVGQARARAEADQQKTRAESEAEKPRVEAAKSERVASFTQEMLSGVDPAFAQGKDTTLLRKILDTASEKIDTELKDEPLVEAQIRNTIGTTYQALGLYPQAQPYFTKALAIRRRVLGDDHPDTLTSINNMGSLLQDMGKLDEALPYYNEALEGFRRVLGDDHLGTLGLINNMGMLLYSMGKFDEALPYLKEASEVIRRLLGDDHRTTLTSITNMGALLVKMGKYDEALPYFNEALEGFRRVLGDDHPDTLGSINNMGSLLHLMGKLDEALPYYKEALEGSRRVFGNDHPNTLMSIDNMGSLLQHMGKYDEALPYFKEALQGYRRVLGDDHLDTLTSINNMGGLLENMGKLDEALPYYKEALEGSRRVLGDDHPDTLQSINNMGLLLNKMGKYDESISLLKQGEALARRVWTGANKKWLGNYLAKLGTAQVGAGHRADAETTLLEAYPLLADGFGAQHKRTLKAAQALVDLYTAWDADEPGEGHDAKAAQWRAKLPALAPADEQPAEKSDGG